jgi:hypothetical protein
MDALSSSMNEKSSPDSLRDPPDSGKVHSKIFIGENEGDSTTSTKDSSHQVAALMDGTNTNRSQKRTNSKINSIRTIVKINLYYFKSEGLSTLLQNLFVVYILDYGAIYSWRPTELRRARGVLLLTG